MNANDDHKEARLDRACERCGTCLSVCPVFAEVGLESASARGKLSLLDALDQGGLEGSRRCEEILSLCLLCGACSEACPMGLDAHETIRQGRARLVGLRGLTAGKKAAMEVLSRPVVLRGMAAGLHALMDTPLFESLPEDSGLRLRFRLPRLARGRYVPRPAESPLSRLDIPRKPRRTGGRRIAFFTGCSTEYVEPRVGMSALALLRRCGADAYVPEGQGCCGLAAYGMGGDDAAADLAKRNLESLLADDPQAVVTACDSCAAMLKVYYPKLLEGTGLEAAARELSKKMVNLHEILIHCKQAPVRSRAVKPGLKATYHYPCHLHRTLGVGKAHRSLIERLDGLEFVEMEEAERCCGGGGSFNAAHYELSSRIGARKAAAARRAGADLVATSCFGCLFQLRDALHRDGARIRAVHFLELFEPEGI